MIKIIFHIYYFFTIVIPLAVGFGDVTYNSRRSILGAIPVTGRIAYHLLTVDISASNADNIVKLSRKSKWDSQYSTKECK